MLKKLRGCCLTCLVIALVLSLAGPALRVLPQVVGLPEVDLVEVGSDIVSWFQSLLWGGRAGAHDNQAANGVPTGQSTSNYDMANVAYMDADHGFRYGLLSEYQRGLYDQILAGLRSRAGQFDVSETTSDEVKTVFNAVRLDHPEIFWVNGYSFVDRGWSFEILPTMRMSQDEIDAVQAQIDAAVSEVLAPLAADATDYDKLKYCYEWIINATDYVSAAHDQTIQGVFVDHQAVCAGYAAALHYLLNQMGVHCCTVSGRTTQDALHVWNLVWVGGAPTYVDVTWGDPVSTLEDGSVLAGDRLIYDYLCVTTEEIERDHTAWDPEQPLLPVCDATDYDYYRLNGRYLETFSMSALASLISEAHRRGESSVRFKMANQEEYDAALAFLGTPDVAWCFDFPVGSIAYAGGGSLYMLEVFWE